MQVILVLCIGTLYQVIGLSESAEHESRIRFKEEEEYTEDIPESEEKYDITKIGIKNYGAEKKAGEQTLLGPTQHRHYPQIHPDLGRRFVFQYPYKEKTHFNQDDQAEVYLHNAIKKFQEENVANNRLRPVKAPPELVLAVATRASIQEALEQKNRLEENNIDKDILRSGNYWNGVWREDVDPNVLRSPDDNAVQSVNVRIMPGTKLYDKVLALKKISPRLIYVINKE